LRCYDDQINEKEDKKGSAVILLLILFEQKEVENKDVKLKESESTISGLQFSNSQMESKIAHMQEQMEFWDEEVFTSSFPHLPFCPPPFLPLCLPFSHFLLLFRSPAR